MKRWMLGILQGMGFFTYEIKFQYNYLVEGEENEMISNI